MKNSCPTSAYQFQKSNSQSSLVWKPRPSTAIFPPTSASNMNVSIEQSIDSDHAALPKDSLGSRMTYTVTRPMSAVLKPKPAYEVNTKVLSKLYECNEEILSKVPVNKFERFSLGQRLRNICNTRSFKLLEDSVKQDLISQPKPKESLISEIKEIWGKTCNSSNPIKLRPQTAGYRPVKTVYLPGVEKQSLAPIPEKKDYILDPDRLDIAEEDMKYFKKTCEIKVMGQNMGLNIPVFPEFPKKLIKKSRSSHKLRRSETQAVIRNKEFNCNLII